MLLEAIAKLPIRQREVIALRDISGWSAAETRNALGLSETNQRVLLHRARSKVRAALERHFEADELGRPLRQGLQGRQHAPLPHAELQVRDLHERPDQRLQ